MLDDPEILDHNDSARLMRPRLRGVVEDLDYFSKEIEYILSRFEPDDIEAYLTVKREGRGVAPRVDRALRRRLLDEVIVPYTNEKADRGLLDWNDVAVRVAHLDPATRPTWDVLVVDEAQDFSANQVRAILAHLSEPASVTFIIDAAQRIYPRFFTWREAGVDSFNATYALRRNYRNTRQIAAFAASLLDGLHLDDDGTMPDFTACTAEGLLPLVIEGRFSAQIDVMLRHLVKNVDLTSESIAFLHPLGGGWFDYVRDRLRRAGLPYAELTRASTWPSGAESVAISTLASAKGLEFDHVLMPGLNQQVTPHGTEPGHGQLDTVRRLVAMGVGRARQTVALGYKGEDPSTVIGLLDPETYKLMRAR
jgi:superfamily I DNA/RNA helicase